MLVNPGVIHSVTLHSFAQCNRMDYPCNVTEWITSGLARMGTMAVVLFNIENVSLTSFAKKSELDDH